MERLKTLNEVLEPDTRMSSFSTTLESDHEKLSQMVLSQKVPEDVRSYFETIKNLCLYGRFVYAFYQVAEWLTYPLMELALRERLYPKKKGRAPGFRTLLKRAIERGLIKEESFSHVRRIRQQQAMMDEALRHAGLPVNLLPPADTYLQILAETLPSLRNYFAHPRGFAIQTPGGAFFSIRFASEFINQLFETSD